jgi:hypothetical protein
MTSDDYGVLLRCICLKCENLLKDTKPITNTTRLLVLVLAWLSAWLLDCLYVVMFLFIW